MPDHKVRPKPRRRPLPAIGNRYAFRAPLWRYHVLGDQRPHVYEVNHHVGNRVAFDGDPEHTFSTYWINKHLTQCQPDASPLNADYIEQQKAELQRQEAAAAARPPLCDGIDQLIRDTTRS
ncbi:hypothetical protein CTZ27_29920 [Streptomyces griseocarneus]|nr:hypothetical protein CTZ27_29920 [Streptomyces griseocarneus]